MRVSTSGNVDFFWCRINLNWAYTHLLRSILQQTKNIHTAYDVLHDAIVKYAVKSSLQHIEEPHAYLRSIVKTTLVDYYRESAHYVSEDGLMDCAQWVSDNLASECYSPEKIADLKQRMHALQAVIDCLPPKCRQVFWLHRIEGKAQTEIASELNISLNMVEKHMIRALVDIALAKTSLLEPL